MTTLLQESEAFEVVSFPRPTFVDMRSFARDRHQGISVEAHSGDDRFLSCRRVLAWPAGAVTAGVIELKSGQGMVSFLPADECVIVHDGQLTLIQADTELTFGPGQAALIPRGASFSWTARGSVSLIFTRYNRSQTGSGQILRLKEAPELKPSGPPPLDLLTTSLPSCRNHTDYTSADGDFMCGTWDSTPYERRPLFYKHFELMHLLQGCVDFVDETGRRRTFSKGDIFLIERGARCTWESREHVAKVYVIYQPK